MNQQQEVITTHLSKNRIFNISIDKKSRETKNNLGIHLSLLPNNKSNVKIVKDNVEISETVDKPMNKNDNVQKEHSNKTTLDSVIDESDVTKIHDRITTYEDESLFNNNETMNNNKDDISES